MTWQYSYQFCFIDSVVKIPNLLFQCKHFTIGSTHQGTYIKLQEENQTINCYLYFYRLPCVWNATPAETVTPILTVLLINLLLMKYARM